MTNPNDPANPHFEVHETNGVWVNTTVGGLTKREYFAAMAMQGLLAHPLEVREVPAEPAIAGMARLMADALIAKLNEPTTAGGKE